MIKKISVIGFSLATLVVVILIGYNVRTEWLAAHAADGSKPSAQTTAATDVVGTSALLHAIVNNNGGANGHAWFEYGTNPHAATYEQSWPGKIGTQSIWGSNDMNLAVFLTDLTPNTTYYFRLKAENSLGTVTGATFSFKTTAGHEDRECANGTTLTRDEARAAMFAKKITTVFSINGTTHQAQATVTNNTACALPASMASWKMFDRLLSHQVRFDATPVFTIPSKGNHVFKVNIPETCMAQVDTFHGEAPTSLKDNDSANDSALGATFNLNSGTSYTDASGPFCTNTPNPAILKIVKTVINDNGGTKQASDFALYQNTTRVQNGEVKTYTFSTANGTWPVTVSETNLPGYTAGTWGGDCTADGKVVLHVGENKVCTITNNDNPPVTIQTATLKIVKTVINDNGGTKQVSDFKLFQDGVEVTSNVDKTYSFASANDNKIITVSENNLPGYTAGTWEGDCSANGTVTLHPGEHKTCRITNNDNPPTTVYGCIAIHKEAYDVNNNRINPTPAFTFKLDNNNTIVTDANGNATVNSVPVGTHTISEVVPSGWTLDSVNPNANGTITVGSGSGCTEITFKNKQVQTTSNLSATCAASKNPALLNETVYYYATATGGNGTYSYSWSGDDSISGNSNSVSKAYSSTGTKNARVVVTSGGQTVTADCSTSINNPPGGGGGGFSLSCAASPNSNVYTGTPVTFTVYPINGSGNYTYSWSGDDSISGNNASVTHTYYSSGVKNATIALTMNGQIFTAQCSVVIYQTPGTCNYGCGGYVPPTVTVTREGGGQVAGVFLSQVPYTGIGSNLKIALFMLALFSWSAWLSYIIIKRKAKKHGLTVAQVFQGSTGNSTLAFANAPTATQDPRVEEISNMKVKAQGTIPVMTNIPRADITAIPHEPKKVERPQSSVKSPFLEHMQAATPAVAPKATDHSYDQVFKQVNAVSKKTPEQAVQVAKPQAQIALPSTTEDIIETLESRARELQTLISADGLEIIAKAAQNNKHNATIILNHLIELYRGSETEAEGDWMVLNADKIGKIIFSTYVTMTPVFIGWLAHGDEKKTMAFIRMIQLQGQTIKDFVMNIVIELDKAYRFRVENTGDADATILDATMNWSNQELEQVIHTLVTAVDQTYSSVYSSVKIAMVKVLDLAHSQQYTR